MRRVVFGCLTHARAEPLSERLRKITNPTGSGVIQGIAVGFSRLAAAIPLNPRHLYIRSC
jgi:hypothetical protein